MDLTRLLCLGFLLSCVHSEPMTTMSPEMSTSSGTTKTTESGATTVGPMSSMDMASGMTDGTTESPETVTEGQLLRRQLAISPESPRIRGRIVLANTRLEGSDEWGVSAKQAEAACERIARYQSESGPISPLIRVLLHRFISPTSKDMVQPMIGHLLSVGSSREVLALKRLLSPLPQGSYWTGGRLVRYRVNSMHDTSHRDHVILTWSDGRTGTPTILGMSSQDREQLREGYNYCLALDLRDSTWQARHCSDQLPYACLITPRSFGFSNKVTGSPEEAVKAASGQATAQPGTTTTHMGEQTTPKPAVMTTLGAMGSAPTTSFMPEDMTTTTTTTTTTTSEPASEITLDESTTEAPTFTTNAMEQEATSTTLQSTELEE